jgi:regulator of protease activity HflC (stomatin/prohibitin superfamily)
MAVFRRHRSFTTEDILMKLPFIYFDHAGPNDFVAFTRGGKERRSGNGLAGWLMPGTSAVIVPLGVKTVSFNVREQTADKQMVRVSGDLVVVNTPSMREHFDFSVFPRSGEYRNDPSAQVEDQVRIAVIGPIRALLATMSIADVSARLADIEQMLANQVSDTASPLMQRLSRYAITVHSISVKSAVPEDRELQDAQGAKEKQDRLSEADAALAARRKRAAEDERAIRLYNEETSRSLVQEQAKRIKAEGENKLTAARTDAEAATILMDPYRGKSGAEILALSLMKAAEKGLDRVSIDPSLLAAMNNITGGQ